MDNQQLLSYIKNRLYRNATEVDSFEDRGFSIVINYTYSWKDTKGNTTYHKGRCSINNNDFKSFIDGL